MWTLYDWQIDALESDIRVVDATVSALGTVDARMCSLDGHLSNLGLHISSGFQVACSMDGMTRAAKDSLASSRSTLARARRDMEDELDSLMRQRRGFVAEAERARREAARRAAEQGQQQYGSSGEGR